MYVVTGGAGFIGSNIVAALDDRQPGSVLVCDRLRDGVKWSNLAKRELIDIIPPEELFGFLDRHASDIEAMIHMGAISSTVETDADRIIATNYRLSQGIWRWCAHHRVRLIYASSAATYGDGSKGFDDDASSAALAALRPLNAYGWSKNLFDRRVARLLADREESPPQWAGLKFFNVYGPNEYHKARMASAVFHAFDQIQKEGKVKLFRSHNPKFRDGEQLRDFVYVKDVTEVCLWLLRTRKPETSAIYNLGSGKARTFSDLAKNVFTALDKKPEIEFIDTPADIRDKYQYFTEAKMEKLKATGCDVKFHSLEEGISDYTKNYLLRSLYY